MTMKTSIQALESTLHTYLANIGDRVWAVREALAIQDFDEAEVLCAALMAHLTLQLEELEWDEDAAAPMSKPRAGFVLDYDPLDALEVAS